MLLFLCNYLFSAPTPSPSCTRYPLFSLFYKSSPLSVSLKPTPLQGFIMSKEVLITRIESFSAAHRLYSHALSAEENTAIFGKCSRENGHGHNYKVEVRVKGPVDPITGMVMNITDLKALMGVVLDKVDHRNLDKDVPYFADKPSTAENLAVFWWEELVGRLPGGVRLNKIKIWETEKNVASYKG